MLGDYDAATERDRTGWRHIATLRTPTDNRSRPSTSDPPKPGEPQRAHEISAWRAERFSASIGGVPEGTWEERGSTLVRRRPNATPIQFRLVDGRLKVGAVFLEGRRATDLTRSPGAVRGLLLDRRPLVEPDDIVAVANRLSALLEDNGVWTPGPRLRQDLVGVLLGGAFPLAALAMDRGAGPVEEVPTWAVDALVARTARTGARAAFGDRATRPVVSALAESLVPPPVDGSDYVGPTDGTGPRALALVPLALARMAGDVLDADRLAAVLSAPGPHRSPDEWPTNEDIATVAAAAPSFGPQRTRQVLIDAAAMPRGPARLVAMAQLWQQVRDLVQGRLPMGLVDLEELCRGLSPHDPVDRPALLVGRTRPVPTPDQNPDAPQPRRRATPPAAPQPAPAPARNGARGPAGAPPVGAVPAPAVEPQPVAPHHRALRAPTATGAALHPADAAQAVDGLNLGNLTLRVGRTGRELTRWGNTLRNCLGDYASAVLERRSVVIAVERHGRVVAAVEVTPGRTIRQFHGPANQPPPANVERVVIEALTLHRVIVRPPTPA